MRRQDPFTDLPHALGPIDRFFDPSKSKNPGFAPLQKAALLLLSIALIPSPLTAAPPAQYRSGEDFAKYAEKLRESALNQIPAVEAPRSTPSSSRSTASPRDPASRTASSTGSVSLSGSASILYPWKLDIVTTIFWVGERPTANNPTPNFSSSWDLHWSSNYGGFDDPNNRRGFLPARFVPKLNPFYCALPYNDVTRGTTKPEAKVVIPWFRRDFEREGKSVCKDRWVAIRSRKTNRVAYAQWSDCGPFRTDHWQYVFGKERPKANLNGGAGLDVSPAVRDYLGISSTDVTDWRFVEARDVPDGPWCKLGENNTFVQQGRASSTRVVSSAPSSSKTAPARKP
jgi:hypothetical protein